MKCPNCNKEVLPEWKTCPFCEFKPKLCSDPNCKSGWLPQQAHFCPKCGSPVKGEEGLNLKESIAAVVAVKAKDGSSVGNKPEKGRLSFVIDDVSFDMIKVEAGTFYMGDSEYDGNPIHEVELTHDYYIGETQVTQALWEAVGCQNNSTFEDDDNPVENVSWEDCQKFINKLNQKLRKQIEPLGMKFRLPTEAEWEFAARGGNESGSYDYAGSDDLDEAAWYDGNSDGETHNVAEKKPNELGIYDMTGNVWEWCQDWYGSDYYYKSPAKDPIGPSSGSSRVLRGGSWSRDAEYCRVAYRDYYGPGARSSYIGFRLALVHQKG